VPGSGPSSEPHNICYITTSVEAAPIENESFKGLNPRGEEDCVLSPPTENPADLLSDLFPELQAFPTPLPDGVEAMDCGDVPVEMISIHVTPTRAGLEGHVSPEADNIAGGFSQGSWALEQPSLSDLSLLSNDEMDLELERFGYSNCFDAKDDPLSSKDEEEASHEQSCSNVNSFQQGGTPMCEHKDLKGPEPQGSYPELYPESWGHIQNIHPGVPLGPHHLEEAYSRLDVAMANDCSAFSFPPCVIPGPLSTHIGSFISCPYPRDSPVSIYMDKGRGMRNACYCDGATDIACPGPYCAVDVGSYAATTGADSVATGESNCLERPQGDFMASPYPYLRPRLYPIHPLYTDDTVPHHDGYTSMESDTTSSYTISRPSSCTISRSVSAQGTSYLGNFERRIELPPPVQQQGSHGSSPEWTPPSTPLYVQFHSTYNFGNTQVESSQNSIRVQHFNNQTRAYPSITPSNNAFAPAQVAFTEDGSKGSYAGTRKNCMEPRQDNNELLVRLRDQGVSYKEIKKRLNCPEAESTLRGRHRTLTKDKSQRVRKPVWTDNDIRILINCVTGLILSPQNNQVSEERENGCKISARWKYISEEILRVGGSYKFGPGTCKKKYKELVETGAAPAIQELEKRRGYQRGEAREERCARLRGRRKSVRRTKCSAGTK